MPRWTSSIGCRLTADFHASDEQLARDRRKREWLVDDGWVIDVFTKELVFPRSANPQAIVRAGIIRARRLHGRPVREFRWPA